MSDQTQWIFDSQKNHLHPSTNSSDIGLSGILQALIGPEDFRG